MKKIEKEELYGHVREYLKAKGIDLQEGSYTRTIEKGCQVLADTINLSQQAMERAKAELERTLEQARQVIHEQTAPRKPPVHPQPPPVTPSADNKQRKSRPRKAKSPGSVRGRGKRSPE